MQIVFYFNSPPPFNECNYRMAIIVWLTVGIAQTLNIPDLIKNDTQSNKCAAFVYMIEHIHCT